MDGNGYNDGAGTHGNCGCIRKLRWGKKADVPYCNLAGGLGCIKDDGCQAYRDSKIEQLSPDSQRQDSI